MNLVFKVVVGGCGEEDAREGETRGTVVVAAAAAVVMNVTEVKVCGWDSHLQGFCRYEERCAGGVVGLRHSGVTLGPTGEGRRGARVSICGP